MFELRWVCAAALTVLLAATAVAQQGKQQGKQTAAQKAQAAAAAAAAARQQAFTEFETAYKDKNLPKDVIEALFAINIDRTSFDRVQRRNNHPDPRMIQAARDTRDLGLKGRQNFDDISNSTREEISALRKHAGLKAQKSDDPKKKRSRSE